MSLTQAIGIALLALGLNSAEAARRVTVDRSFAQYNHPSSSHSSFAHELCELAASKTGARKPQTTLGCPEHILVFEEMYSATHTRVSDGLTSIKVRVQGYRQGSECAFTLVRTRFPQLSYHVTSGMDLELKTAPPKEGAGWKVLSSQCRMGFR